MSTITLDQALDTIMQLPLEQQEMLIEIWYKRRIEARRQEIARDAQDSLAAFRSGQYKPQPVTSLSQIMDEISDNAAAKGMTPELLESLLSNE